MTNEKKKIIRFQTSGTCSKMIGVSIIDNVINDIEFLGGCQGNLTGIAQLVKGMTVDEVIKRLQGIQCGNKGTSCPDQLAKCLIEYKNKSAVVK